jgi:thioredoxin-related protein
MNLRILPACAALLLGGALSSPALATGPAVTGAPAHNPAWLTSKKDAFAKAKSEKKLVILDAFANWCGWCKKLDKDVLDTPQFIDFAKPNYVLLRLNTEDGKDGSKLAQQFGIANLPTTLVLDAEENLVGRIGGYVGYEQFRNHLGNFKTQWAELQKKEAEAKGSRAKDAPFLFDLAKEWENRSNLRRAAALYASVADMKAATTEQRARAAWGAGVIALRLEKIEEAEKRLRQLDSTKPFPKDLDGLPELLRSDIAAMRGDLDAAIAILEELLEKGDQNGAWRGSLPQRISELRARRDAQGRRG